MANWPERDEGNKIWDRHNALPVFPSNIHTSTGECSLMSMKFISRMPVLDQKKGRIAKKLITTIILLCLIITVSESIDGRYPTAIVPLILLSVFRSRLGSKYIIMDIPIEIIDCNDSVSIQLFGVLRKRNVPSSIKYLIRKSDFANIVWGEICSTIQLRFNAQVSIIDMSGNITKVKPVKNVSIQLDVPEEYRESLLQCFSFRRL